MDNIYGPMLPDSVKCFKYHYPVDVPVREKDGTNDSIHGQHWTTGKCSEDLKFKCQRLRDSSSMTGCQVEFVKIINTQEHKNSTLQA